MPTADKQIIQTETKVTDPRIARSMVINPVRSSVSSTAIQTATSMDRKITIGSQKFGSHAMGPDSDLVPEFVNLLPFKESKPASLANRCKDAKHEHKNCEA